MNPITMAIEAAQAFRYARQHKEAGRMAVHLPPPSPQPDAKLIARLLSCAHLAKQHQAAADPVYQASGEWSAILEMPAFKLGDALATMFRDGSTSIGSSYSARRLNGITGAVKKAFIVRDVHRDIRVWRAITDSPVADLAAPDVGSPWGVTLDGVLMYPGVHRAHYFAEHVARLLNGAGTVVEIGGGYGELAYRLLRRRPLRYICFDLPEVLIKAAYFLTSALPDKRVLLYDEVGTRRLTAELLAQYDIVLMPNFKIRDMPEMSADLLVNTRSLSEMGKPAIDDYMREMGRITRRYFLHENSSEAAVWYGHAEIPASAFPVPATFRRIYTQKSPWWIGDGQGALGRYVECLYERR
jgi:hypothetical protein